jgi:cardiolipin synthase A/B
VLDSAFAAGQARQFETDKARSTEMTLERWLRRPLRERLTERLAALLRSQL